MKFQARHERIDSKHAHKHPKPGSSQEVGSTLKLPLEEIVGLTVSNRNGLASNASTSYCVYTAGCVAVAYDVDSGSQSHFTMKYRPPKPLSCVAVSLDGRFVAAGEGGKQPAVLVWYAETKTCIAELKGHQYGVTCIAFSPDSKLLASSGCSRDGYICLWDIHHKKLITKVKESSPCNRILSLTFSADAKYIVTAGIDHLKLWMITPLPPLPQPHPKMKVVPLALHGKPINLSGQKLDCFVSVACTKWSKEIDTHSSEKPPPVFALTDSGMLCLIQAGQLVEVVDLMVEKSFAMSVSSKIIACACNNGTVKLFNLKNLTHSRNLYFSGSTSCNDERSTSYHKEANENDSPLLHRDPDALACQLLSSDKLVVIYSGHSLYIWDIHYPNTATRCFVLAAHSACIMDIKPLPCDHLHDPSSSCIARGCSGGVSFASCSADGVIRLWDLIYQPRSLDNAREMQTQVYAADTNPFCSTHIVSSGIFERDMVQPKPSTQGFRSMAVTSDGKYLAAGDCKGNLHIYDLCTSDCVCIQDAHDAEILCLSFSSSSRVTGLSEDAPRNQYLLASGGRDGVIHIFDVKRNFHPVASIENHSSVTSVKLSSNGCKILSCTADGCLSLRDIVLTENGFHAGRCHRLTASDGIVCDMDADSNLEIAVSVGRDMKIKMFNLTDGKLSRSFRQLEDFGEPINITMDQSLSYILCSYSNKSICLYDLSTGQMVAQASGHSQVVTEAIFLPDCGHIISVGGDSSMFVWKIPSSVASRMLQKTMEKYGHVSPTQLVALDQLMVQGEESHEFKADTEDTSAPENLNELGHRILLDEENPHFDPPFNFSVSRLPKWARAKVKSSDIIAGSDTASSSLNDDEKYVSSGIVHGGLCHAQNSHECDLQDCQSVCQEDSPDSPITDGPCSFSRNKDKCWHRIHTVCLDLLSSPELYGVTDNKPAIVNQTEMGTSGDQNPTSSRTLSDTSHPASQYTTQAEELLAMDGEAVDMNDNTKSNYNSILSEGIYQYQANDPSACKHGSVDESADMQHQSSGCQGNTILRTQDNTLVFPGDDLFNIHFGCSSETLQLQGKHCPPVKRRYSSRFSLRRDYVQGFKKPFQDVGVGMFKHGDSSTQTTSKAMPIEERRGLEPEKIPPSPERKLVADSCITGFSMQSSPENVEQANKKRGINTCGEDRGGIENMFSCKDALINLANAAKIAFESFSKLQEASSASNYGGDMSCQPERHLYSEAKELVPLIAEQVESLAKLVNSSTRLSLVTHSDESRFKKQKR